MPYQTNRSPSAFPAFCVDVEKKHTFQSCFLFKPSGLIQMNVFWTFICLGKCLEENLRDTKDTLPPKILANGYPKWWALERVDSLSVIFGIYVGVLEVLCTVDASEILWSSVEVEVYPLFCLVVSSNVRCLATFLNHQQYPYHPCMVYLPTFCWFSW